MSPPQRRLTLGLVTALAAVALIALAATVSADPAQDRKADGKTPTAAVAVLRDLKGAKLGSVLLQERKDGSLLVSARTRGLSAGFHGFHVHNTGRCDPATKFASAGPHLGAERGQTHGQTPHSGDLPSLLVNPDGTASLALRSGFLSLADVLDANGSAIIAHSSEDNYANIPDRYDPDPDTLTRETGDSGDRLQCGEFRPA